MSAAAGSDDLRRRVLLAPLDVLAKRTPAGSSAMSLGGAAAAAAPSAPGASDSRADTSESRRLTMCRSPGPPLLARSPEVRRGALGASREAALELERRADLRGRGVAASVGASPAEERPDATRAASAGWSADAPAQAYT